MYEIFQKAERIEVLSAAIYHQLAQRFGSEPDARALFLRLEEEELQHASRVRLMAARYMHDRRLAAAPADPGALDLLLVEAEAALRAVQDGTFARTAEEALARAAELEERFARAHADRIARETHPALAEFFRQLAAQDRAHRELLKDK